MSACSFHNPEIVINRLCREYAILDDSKYPGEKGIEIFTCETSEDILLKILGTKVLEISKPFGFNLKILERFF